MAMPTGIKSSKSIPVYTDNPENEMWDFITDFESKQFVQNYIPKRVNTLNYRKNNTKHELIREKDSDSISIEVSNNAKQARDFFFMSKQLSLLSKPVMLFYSFEKLAMMLTSLTFQKDRMDDSQNKRRPRFTHGLSFYPESSLHVWSCGLFPLLHDCVSGDDIIHQKKFSLLFENILHLGPVSHVRLALDTLKGSDSYPIKDLKSDCSTRIAEIERQFVFMFALSTYSRYRVIEWERILSGEDNLIPKIRRYLNSVELLFPNLILNQLHNKIISFYSPAKLATVEVSEYDTPIELL
jgi:hypothetical protein